MPVTRASCTMRSASSAPVAWACQFVHPRDGREEQMRGAIAPHRLEVDEDASVRAELEAVLGERGAEQVAAELFKAGAIVGSAPAMGGEIEAIARGLARAARGA